jgi:HAD superfamily hydrolase (TIGR01493 family)
MNDTRGVLFDFGSTLFAHAPLAETIEEACRQLGDPRSAEWSDAYAARVEVAAHTVEELRHPRDLDADVWRARWHVLYALADDEVPGLGVAIYEAMHDPLQWRPFATTAATLARIHAAGVQVAVVSNTGWDVRSVFVAHHLDQFVNAYVLSYEVGAVKPSAAIFLAACDALGLQPGECLMVGDDARADSGAVTVGLRTLLLPALAPGRDNGVEAAAQIVGGV